MKQMLGLCKAGFKDIGLASSNLFITALLLVVLAICPATTASVVPGTSNPWLAGMPNGSSADGGDSAPAQSPVLVTGNFLTPGTVLQLSASGGVAHGSAFPLVGPDGDLNDFTPHFAGVENGISNINAPVDSMLGLFLDDNQPTLSGAPAMLDFDARGNVTGGINYRTLAPSLKQVFFIGDGITDDGIQQNVTVPIGATRLFLGTMDGWGWFNNQGSFISEIKTLVQYPSGPQISKDGTAVVIEDYASLPLSSRTSGNGSIEINFSDQLGRVNFLRSEPNDAPLSSSRFFVVDMNRNLYILDIDSREFQVYINFEDVFPTFINESGYAGGLVTIAFDPNYANNGIMYTVHTETRPGTPNNDNLPGLDLSEGYETTETIDPPAGNVGREAVLVEWTDTDVNNATFEGTAREIIRVGFNSRIHPMGDLIFNPLAEPNDPDYRNLYISNGDGGAGETSGSRHAIPQRLDALQGKILRITPDVNLRPDDLLSGNGRYRIPTAGNRPNPFGAERESIARREIFAYGFRNPHRMSWDPNTDRLIINDIGFHAWEEVDFVRMGENYGYAEREGPEELFIGGFNHGRTGSQINPPVPHPDPDELIVNDINVPVVPVYPVAAYSHEDGDAVSSGFVYRGSLLPQLYGKYIFGDITTGRVFYCNFDDMIAADDGDHTTMAVIHEIQIIFNGTERRMFDIVADEYDNKGGNAPGSNTLPGSANATNGNDPEGVPYGRGRADIRLAQDNNGELYILSKSDGMIRKITSVWEDKPEGDTVNPQGL